MSSALFHYLLLLCAAFWLLASIVLSLNYGWVRKKLSSLDGRQRFRVSFLLGLSPLLIAFSMTGLVLLPSVGGLFWTNLDHCTTHHMGHDHLCLSHGPGPLSFEAWLLLCCLMMWLVPQLMYRMYTLFRASQRARKLIRNTEDSGFRTVEAETPFAVTVGTFFPKVVVSTGLLKALPSEHLEAVLAHEKAHVQRRDPLFKVAAIFLSSTLLPWTRRKFLSDLELAAEQACDEEAAVKLGDRLRIAQAIVAVERLLVGRALPIESVTTAFDNAPSVQRVESLLESKKQSAPVRLDIILVVIVAFAILFAPTLHHTAETLLWYLGR